VLDTRWKRFKYSGFFKGFISLLILAGGTVFIWCLMWFAIYGDATVSDFADSDDFAQNFLKKSHNIAELTSELKSIEYINETVEDEEERYRLYRRYNDANNNLKETPNFIYVVKNIETGEVVKTNTTFNSDEILSQKNYIYFSSDKVTYHYGSVDVSYELSNYLGYSNRYHSRYLGDEIIGFLAKEGNALYVAVRDNLIPGDVFYDLSVMNQGTSIFIFWWQPLLLISSIVFGIGLIIMAFICGRISSTEEIQINGFDRIFSEVQLIAFVSFIGILGAFASGIGYRTVTTTMVKEVSYQLLLGTFLATMVGLVFYCSLIRQIKGKILFKSTIVGWFIRLLKRAYWRLDGIKILKPVWLLFFIIYGLVNMIFGSILLDSFIYEPFLMILLGLFINMAFGWIFLKQLAPLKEIMETTKRVSDGELEVVLETGRYPMIFKNFYDNIYNVQSGMRKAIQDAVKGERMKTELITNVSHDLKTPLTSIISYVDLLDKENLENEQAKEYVSVLVRKSDMLKRLIDDLIEASKVSSGNVQFDCQSIGLNELIRQGIGEFQERFDEKKLDVRVSETKEVTILADGPSIWRVVENLFDNVTKYALPSSRVYVQLIETEEKGILILKNISESPLEIGPDELMERFVRGSESRTTEGSGLGLSIAEGLVNAQGGHFNIEIDGDLFKVTVEMPLKVSQEDIDANMD
jgi:signal transduction histidine kinase